MSTIRKIAIHELMHVSHGQHHPVGDFTGSESIGWFIEGLAVLASGQLTEDRLARAQDAIAAGHPAALQSAWSGPDRYAVAGSLVAYIDATYGRQMLWDLLSVTNEAALLAALGLSESELLSPWRAWVDQR